MTNACSVYVQLSVVETDGFGESESICKELYDKWSCWLQCDSILTNGNVIVQ